MNRAIKIGIGLSVLIALWVLMAPVLAYFLIVEKPLPTADAMIVLSGSAAYKERTQKAAELFSRGVAKKIFITNDGERSGWSRTERRNIPYVELEQRELIDGGVPADAITVLPGNVTGTEWEARELAKELEARPLKSVVIVTSSFHTRRSLWTFEKLASATGTEFGIEHAPLGDSSPQPWTWWLSRNGWRTVGGEYVKSVAYWVLY